jgi:hypothetical protein
MSTHKDFRLANDPMTNQLTLSKLSHSKCDVIRSAVASNPSTCIQTKLSLVSDVNKDVIENLTIHSPDIIKALNINICKNILLKLVDTRDSEFIMSLRQDKTLNNYISVVSNDIEKQNKWLHEYKEKEKLLSEFYFIINDLNLNKRGTIRIYDFKDGAFWWGSWIVSPIAGIKTAIQSALSIYELCFFTLGFHTAYTNVHCKNKPVINFQKRMGCEEICHMGEFTYFKYTRELYEKVRSKYISQFS